MRLKDRLKDGEGGGRCVEGEENYRGGWRDGGGGGEGGEGGERG